MDHQVKNLSMIQCFKDMKPHVKFKNKKFKLCLKYSNHQHLMGEIYTAGGPIIFDLCNIVWICQWAKSKARAIYALGPYKQGSSTE